MTTYFFINNQVIAQETYNSLASYCGLYWRIYTLLFAGTTAPLSYFAQFLFFGPAISPL